MSEFKFSCPNCQQNIAATNEYCGLQINCPGCNAVITVPDAPEAPPTTASPHKNKLSMAPSTVQHANTSTVMAAATVRKAKKPRYGLYIGLGCGALAAVAAILLIPKAMDKYHQHQEVVAAEIKATNTPVQLPPPDLSASEILQKMTAAYKTYTSYSADGESVTEMDMSAISPALTTPVETKTKISVRLARPSLYRLEWEKTPAVGAKVTQGSVWSAGSGDFLKNGSASSRMKNRETALATAGSNSGTMSSVIASLFFDQNGSMSPMLNSFSKTNNETLDNRKCYVLTGHLGFQNLHIWVHKDDFLIPRLEIVFGGKMDESLLASLPAAQKAQMQKMEKIKGNITETYSEIATNQTMNSDAFQSAIPIVPNQPTQHKVKRDSRSPRGSRQ